MSFAILSATKSAVWEARNGQRRSDSVLSDERNLDGRPAVEMRANRPIGSSRPTGAQRCARSIESRRPLALSCCRECRRAQLRNAVQGLTAASKSRRAVRKEALVELPSLCSMSAYSKLPPVLAVVDAFAFAFRRRTSTRPLQHSPTRSTSARWPAPNQSQRSKSRANQKSVSRACTRLSQTIPIKLKPSLSLSQTKLNVSSRIVGYACLSLLRRAWPRLAPRPSPVRAPSSCQTSGSFVRTRTRADRVVPATPQDKKKGLRYHVKWVGYPESENSWEPADNVQCVPRPHLRDCSTHQLTPPRPRQS